MTLAMICPTRGRPDSVSLMAEAWESTGVIDGGIFRGADLFWIVDGDDPTLARYKVEIEKYPWMRVASIPQWMPMVPKLNWAARQLAQQYDSVGFLGDDHLPRTPGWIVRLAAAIAGWPSIVYGRDGFQDEKLPTWWAMSSSIIRAIGAMVPSKVQHLYCDNTIKVLGEESGTLRYLPDVLIEHMHPVAGKSEWDAGYKRVNRLQQYKRDQAEFTAWIHDGLARDARLIADLRGV